MKKINKRLFISSQIYDTAIMTTAEIETEVQSDLDSFVGENKVKFLLNQLSDKELSMVFFRNVEYHSTSEGSILDADAFVICGCPKEGFVLPDMWPHAPFYHYYLDVDDFLGHYTRSAKLLGASRIKDTELTITPSFIALKLIF